ncbi:MAG: hypothetical protein QNJ91_14510 [Gammaproteobacteria bacterium]|nr:hypothetical protein [Gammaproteobacteria bacterium]
MRYGLIALGGLMLALLALYVIARRQKQQRATVKLEPATNRLTPQAQALKLQASDKFWGYRVESHCSASSRLAGREYTFDDAPPLPVEGCESRSCECCLIGMPERRRVADRRSGQDRRGSIRLDAEDRRAERPRRKADLNSWISYSHL